LKLLLAVCFAAQNALAWAQSSALHGLQTIPMPPIEANLPKVAGAISWELLAKATTKPVGKRLVPNFPTEVLKLHQTQVTMVGYLMPLEAGKLQRKFLLSYSPQTCNFCLPAGPEGVIEVQAKTGVKVSYEPIIIKGRLLILADDPGGMYYRLVDAGV
jgi:hypothetical protein